MIEGFSCQRNVKPIEAWVQEDNPDVCPPCIMQPLTSYYLGALEKAGAHEHARKLESAWNSGDLLTIAKTLDTIKDEVAAPLKKDLIELDCFAQSYKESEEN